jgi:hypothetical protein
MSWMQNVDGETAVVALQRCVGGAALGGSAAGARRVG